MSTKTRILDIIDYVDLYTCMFDVHNNMFGFNDDNTLK